MSLLKSLGGALKRIGGSPAVAAAVGIVNPVAGAMMGAVGAALRPSGLMPAALPGAGVVGMGALPAIGAAARVGIGMAGRAYRGAISLCRKHPAWCSTIGGTAAVAAMIESGQLPAPRHRRGRGISSGNLRAYRRVHNLLAGFCAPKARIKKICN